MRVEVVGAGGVRRCDMTANKRKLEENEFDGYFGVFGVGGRILMEMEEVEIWLCVFVEF